MVYQGSPWQPTGFYSHRIGTIQTYLLVSKLKYEKQNIEELIK